MPFTLNVLDELHLIVLRLTDPVVDATVSEAVFKLHECTTAAPDYDALIDALAIRDTRAISSQGVLMAGRLDKLLRVRGPSRLVIVVNSQDVHGLGRMYLAAAEADEEFVQIAYSLADALDWLGYDAERKATALARIAERPPPG